MAQFFDETAHRNINREKLGEGLERVFGRKPSQFCKSCGFRYSFCECSEEWRRDPTHPENMASHGFPLGEE